MGSVAAENTGCWERGTSHDPRHEWDRGTETFSERPPEVLMNDEPTGDPLNPDEVDTTLAEQVAIDELA